MLQGGQPYMRRGRSPMEKLGAKTTFQVLLAMLAPIHLDSASLRAQHSLRRSLPQSCPSLLRDDAWCFVWLLLPAQIIEMHELYYTVSFAHNQPSGAFSIIQTESISSPLMSSVAITSP